MPVYEYHCKNCKKDFTLRMTVDEHDRQLPECPSCETKEGVEKRIGGAYVITERKS